MIFKPVKRILALAATVLLAFGAQAKNYSVLFTQDFETGTTYTKEIYTGAKANARLGSSDIAPVALPDGYTVYTGSYSLATKDDAKISQEERERYDTKESSHYFRLVRYGKKKANILYQMPSAVTGLTDYRMEIDYLLDTSYNSSSFKGTNGLAICMSGGATLATFGVTPLGKNNVDGEGMLFKGDTTEQLCPLVPASFRGAYDTDKGYWLHILIRGNAAEGVLMSVVNEAGTTLLAETQLMTSFDTVSALYLKADANNYRHCISLDDIVVYRSVDPDTYTWTGAAGDGKWTTPGNWSVGGVAQTDCYPSEYDSAVIAGSGVSVLTEVGQAVSNLNLAAGCTLSFDVGAIEKNCQVPLITVRENVGAALSSANLLLTGYSADACVPVLDASTLAVTVGLYEKTRFVWSGKGGNTLFATVGNWVYGATNGPAATTAPTGNGTVIFPETFADGVTVTFGDSTSGDGIYFVLNCDVTFASDGTAMRTIYPWSITGTGTLSLANHITLQTVTLKDMTVGVDVKILPSAGDDPWASYARFYLRGEKSDITFNGAIKGSGYLRLEGDGNPSKYYYINGDMGGFTGKIFTQYAFNEDETVTTRLGVAAALSLASATLEVEGRVWVTAVNVDRTLSVGALYGTGVIKNCTSAAMKLEVGALNTDAANSVTLTQESGIAAWTVRKVGTGCQTFSGTAMTYNADLKAGELGVPAGKAFGSVALNGGSFKFVVPFEAPWTNGTYCTLFTCTSGVEAGRTVDYVTLDMSSFAEIYDVDYDNSSANTLLVSLVPSTGVISWVGPDCGYWAEAENWIVVETSEHPPVAPGAGSIVEIGAGSRILVATDQAFGRVKADATVKLGVLFTDSALTFTAPAGFGGTIEAAGPYTLAREGYVYTATRVPSTFLWIAGDGDWTEIENWEVGAYPTAVLPGDGDTASFPASLVSVAVTVPTDGYARNVVADADLTLSGTRYLRANCICGDGLLTLNGAKVMCNTDNLDISNDVVVATGSANELRTSVDKNSTFYRISLLGKLSGDGNITANHSGKQGAGVAFYGDNHAFAGTFETTNYNQRDSTYMDSAIASSSNAVWKVNAQSDKSTKNVFPSTDDVYKHFGAYVGSAWLANGTKMEIGHRDDVESTLYAYAHVNYGGYTIRKVGSNALNLKYATSGTGVTKIDALYLEDGTVRVDSDLVPKVITFEAGGALAFASDLSDYIVNSTAPVAVDDQGVSATWTTAIKASNTGGFTKKGTGTLTLAEVPAYTGITKVEAGQLVVPAETRVAMDASSGGTFAGGEITNVVFAAAETTTTVTSDTSTTTVRSFAGPVDYSNVTIDLRGKTDWKRGTTYYIVTSAGIVAGTAVRRPSSEKILLPPAQQLKMRTIDLPGYGKVLVLIRYSGLISFVY